MSRVAIIVANFRTPELSNALKKAIEPTKTPYEFIEIDNGYQTDRKAEIKSKRNLYCAPAHRLGAEYAKAIEVIDKVHFDYYWFIVTCCSIVDNDDPLTKMATFLDDNPNCVICHQGMDKTSNTAWPNLRARGTVPRRTYAVDNVSIMVRVNFYDEVGGVDRRYLRGWCVGLDWSYQARKMGKEIWILDNCLCHRTEAIGWTMGRRDVTREAYNKEAAREMDETVVKKFGFPVPQVYEHLNFDYGGREFEIKG